MDMTSGERPDRYLEEAADWLMRVRDAPADGALRADLEAWLAADPRHARAWDQVRRAWQLAGELPAAAARPADVPRPRRSAAVRRPASRRRRALGLAAGAVAACLAFLLIPSLALRLEADQVTATAETRAVTLADGSIVHLAPQSAIRARFTPARRSVELLAGEAFFEVRPDPGRPFVVAAEGLDATVLGTAFDVRISARALTVGVQKGAVGVAYDQAVPAVAAKLGAGDRITVDRRTGAAVRGRLAPDEVASWRDGRLFVADATVAEVVEELRRYQPGWVILADDRLAAERVTGLYDLNDPARALRALVRPAGGQVREVTPLLHILSMP